MGKSSTVSCIVVSRVRLESIVGPIGERERHNWRLSHLNRVSMSWMFCIGPPNRSAIHLPKLWLGSTQKWSYIFLPYSFNYSFSKYTSNDLVGSGLYVPPSNSRVCPVVCRFGRN